LDLTTASPTYCTALCSTKGWDGNSGADADNVSGCKLDTDGSTKLAVYCNSGFIPTTGNTLCVAAMTGCTIADPGTTTECDTCEAGYVMNTATTGCVIC